MSDDDSSTTEASTRRDYLRYGGAVALGGLLAGCSGDPGAESTPEATATATPTDTPTSTSTSTSTETPTDASDGTGTPEESWSVTIEPAGTETFTEVPESFTVYDQTWVDVTAAIGQFDRLDGIGNPAFTPDFYYDRLPGTSIDTGAVTPLVPEGADAADKELFYEIDPDLNLFESNVATHYLGLDEGDVAELSENVAPFFGSFIRRQQFSEAYPYYSLYEATERAARIFQVEDRYRALADLHDEFVEEIRDGVPSGAELPSYVYMNHNWWGDGQEINFFHPIQPGTQSKVLRDLGLDEATHLMEGEIDGVSVTTDAEKLLEIDPEMIVYHTGLILKRTDLTDFEANVVRAFEEDPVLSEVTAVREGNIVPGPEIAQGPVVNLFNTELLAKRLYPDTFGEYVGLDEVPDGEQLFDRQRVADVINGAL